jgi:farnesyl-diphosphate farnesyltransferase
VIVELLRETSRTFALAVPLLGEPTRRAVGLAYLLFRCADTLEDAARWPIADRRAALASFADLMAAPSTRDLEAAAEAAAAAWLAAGVSDHAGYRRLLARLPGLLAAVAALPPAPAEAIRSHVRRTALGMRDMVAAAAAGLPDLPALREYCYVVAGIVGELLTALFLGDAPSLAAVAGDLGREARAFGEGLQLVNILKDERTDRAEGRSFLPPAVPRAAVLVLAEQDLAAARRYIAALERGSAPRELVAFTSLPCELAEKTLALLRRDGPGAKVSRGSVIAMVERYYALARQPCEP